MSYPKRECIICKNEFKPKSWNGKYCSQICRDRGMEINLEIYNSRGNQYARYKVEVAKRGLAFDLTIDEYFTIKERRCCYCGYKEPDKLRGIDRLDNTRGYEKGNCVASCYLCNMMKGRIEINSFLYLCEEITKYQQLKAERNRTD